MISLTALSVAYKHKQAKLEHSPANTERVFQESAQASNTSQPTFDEKKVEIRTNLLGGKPMTLKDARHLVRSQRSEINERDEYGYTILDYTKGKENPAVKLLERSGAKRSPDPMIFHMSDSDDDENTVPQKDLEFLGL
ncbi:MAG: hypothetical protein ChlgKO_06700 [Chlamydiales bacterium]